MEIERRYPDPDANPWLDKKEEHTEANSKKPASSDAPPKFGPGSEDWEELKKKLAADNKK